MQNFHLGEDGEKYGPLDAIRHVREAGELPDGSPIPAHLKLTLLALVSYWPDVFPSMESLARDTALSRRQLAANMRELHDLDLVRTRHEGRKAYRLLQLDRLVRVRPTPRSLNQRVGKRKAAELTAA